MFDQCIYFNLSALTRQITKIWQDEFALLGLSPSHGYLLAAMCANSSASQKELSETMQLDASTITRFTDVLVKKQLVERMSAGKGGRFRVTPSGIKLAKKVDRAMDDLFSEMEQRFGKRDFKRFVHQLQQARQTIEESNP